MLTRYIFSLSFCILVMIGLASILQAQEDSKVLTLLVDIPHPDAVGALSFSPDGSYLATGCDDQAIRLFRVHRENSLTVQLERTLSVEAGPVTALAFSSDNQQLLSGHGDGVARLWNVSSGTLLQRYGAETPFDAPIATVGFSPNGKQVLVGCRKSQAVLFERNSGTPQLDFYHPLRHQLQAVAMDDSGKVLTGTDQGLFIWNTNGDDIEIFNHSARKLQFYDRLKTLLVVGNHAELWNYPSKTVLYTFGDDSSWDVVEGLENNYLPSQLHTADWSPSGNVLVTGHEQGIVSVWFPAAQKRFVYQRHAENITAVAFSPVPGEDHFAVADQSGRVVLWRMAMENDPALQIPTPTPRPPEPITVESHFDTIQFPTIGYTMLMGVHPITGEIYQGGHGKMYRFAPPDEYGRVGRPEHFANIPGALTPEMIEVAEDGTIYFASDYMSEFIVALKPSRQEVQYQVVERGKAYGIRDLYVVKSADRIPNTKPGDVLVSTYYYYGSSYDSTLWKIDPTQRHPKAEQYLPPKEMPPYISGLCSGPDHRLYLMSSYPCKIYVVTGEKTVRESTRFVVQNYGDKFVFMDGDQSFYFFSSWDRNNGINRLNVNSKFVESISSSRSLKHSEEIMKSPDGTWLYFFDDSLYSIMGFRLKTSNILPTPTPEPSLPTPTPTPIPGWFILDGFGGVHSTNPTVRRPNLPYFPELNIARDLEPDPQGKGWYMLDGMGGIHTSAPDLPKPDNLPYFGFDVARDLEVKQVNGEYRFYMLDSYGVIHSSAGDVDYGYFPWLNSGTARDLEPDPASDGWMIMDSLGRLYFNRRPHYDQPMKFFPGHVLMRDCVRFDDESTVLVDALGGRYTNELNPAHDVLNDLPLSFYFGFEIIWDVEVVPENWIR